MTRPLAGARPGGRSRRVATGPNRPGGKVSTGLSLAMLLAGLAVVAGCSSQASRVAAPEPIAPAARAHTPSEAVVTVRETRYYVDENGALWDDRGRKIDTVPKPM